jgi:hypothetical protein
MSPTTLSKMFSKLLSLFDPVGSYVYRNCSCYKHTTPYGVAQSNNLESVKGIITVFYFSPSLVKHFACRKKLPPRLKIIFRVPKTYLQGSRTTFRDAKSISRARILLFVTRKPFAGLVYYFS